MFDNLLMLTDGYKHSHWMQYPPDTEKVYSFLESRGGDFQYSTVFGLQYILKRYLSGQVVTKEKIDKAEKYINAYFGNDKIFNREGWEYILNNWNGFLPVYIKAIPEGLLVPTGNVLMTIENIDNKCYWLTNFIETLLLQVWYPSTIAMQSREFKKQILGRLKNSGDPSTIDWKLHDFGFRGSTSVESSALGGAAHLLSFRGTDTLSAIEFIDEIYYDSMAGGSIPAAEHSTITSWGKERELEAYKNMLQQYPSGLVAVVSDSYDIFNACENLWGKELKNMILNRDGVLVIRPDSGEINQVLPKIMGILHKQFGAILNNKQYYVLNPHVRVIWGDGINKDTIEPIYRCIEEVGYSSDNLTLGSGGGLLQNVNRDTQKWAIKCSYVKTSSEEVLVYKDPVTDPGKRSKKGLLSLVKDHEGCYTTEERSTYFDHQMKPLDYLVPKLSWGSILEPHENFQEIRQRLNEGL